MTKEEVDILWNKALRESIDDGSLYTRYRFAELVAEAEREMCAQVVEQGHYAETRAGHAAAIRARGQK